MSDYIPTTEEVRAAASRAIGSDWFDRRLAVHDAEVRASVLAERGESEWEGIVIGRERAGEGYWFVTEWRPDELEKARTYFPHSEYRLGSWLPAEEGDS